MTIARMHEDHAAKLRRWHERDQALTLEEVGSSEAELLLLWPKGVVAVGRMPLKKSSVSGVPGEGALTSCFL